VGTVRVLFDMVLYICRLQMPTTRNSSDNKHLLLCYVMANDVQRVRLLLAHGADVNWRLDANQTALCIACSNGFVELAYVLLTRGSIITRDPCPLLAAVTNGHLVCVYLLLKHNVRAERRSVALLAAWECKNYRIMELLLDHGADLEALCNGPSFDIKSFLETTGGEHISLVLKLFSRRLNLIGPDVQFARRFAFIHGLRDVASGLLKLEPGANDADSTALALFYSAKYNWPGIVMNLLLHKVDVNSVLPGHGTALYAACCEGHEDIVELLLSFGVNPNFSHDDCDDSLPLCVAVRRGFKHIVTRLIDCGAVISRGDCGVLLTDATKSRVLRLAFDYGHMDVIGHLAENDPNDGSIRHGLNQLLCEALLQLDLNRAECLINFGADLSYVNQEGETFLHIVCAASEVDGRGSESNDNVSSVRHQPCCEALVAIVKLLLRKGVDCDVLSTNGLSPLYVACEHHHVSVVRILIDAGCSVHRSSSVSSHHPLLKACELRNAEIIETLLSTGASINCVNSLRESALHVAIGSIAFSCDDNCAVDKRPSYYAQAKAVLAKTEQSLFSENDSLAVIEILLRHGADCNAVSLYGETPLYRAVVRGARSIVRLLLKFDCNPNITTTDKFPLFAALLRGDKQIVNALCHSKIQICMNIATCSNAQCKRMSILPKTKSFDRLSRMLATDILTQTTDTVSGLLVMCVCSAKKRRPRREVCLKSGLSLACEQIDESLVGLLLSRGADVNFADVCGKTPLHSVFEYSLNAGKLKKSIDGTVVRKTVAIVKLLLANKPLIDAVSVDQQTPLYMACAGQLVDAVQLLLDAGANPNVGMSPLRMACGVKNFKIVEMLLNHGALSTTVHCLPAEDDGVPLIFAAQRNCVRLVQKVLKHRSNVNELDQRGRSALSYVVDNLLSANSEQSEISAYKCFNLLLEHNADVSIADSNGCSPIYMACEMCRVALVEKMLQLRARSDSQLTVSQDSGQTNSSVSKKLPLCIAADRGYEKIVSLLIHYGENINQADSQGNTALHLAMKYVSLTYHQCWVQDEANKSDYEAVLQILLKNGADVNIVNGRGETPLCIAVNRGLQKVCCNLLLNSHANPNVGKSDKLPLSAASERNDIVLMKLLLSHGADPDVLAKNSKDMRSYDVPVDPIENGKLMPGDDARNNYMLPLCIAARRGNSAMLELLIEHKASVDLCDNEGLTPLLRAIQFLYSFSDWKSVKNDDEAICQMISIVKRLLEVGADPNCESRLGLGPIYYALSILINLRLQLIPSLLCQIVCAGKSTAFVHAVIAVIKLLVDHGASIEDTRRNLGDQTDAQLSIVNFLATVDSLSYNFIVWLFQAGAGFGLLSLLCRLLSEKSVGGFCTTICKVVVLAGYKTSSREIEEIALIDTGASETATNLKQDLIHWLQDECRNPPRLMRLCRTAIRNELLRTFDYQNIIPHIDSLQIPEQIISYLKYESSLSEIDLVKAVYSDEVESAVCLPEPVELQSFRFDGVFCTMEKDVLDDCE
jgi:ankyrin repeat protein